MNNIFTWKKGEKLAYKYLKENGYKIIANNAKNQFAEVDIIAEIDDEIVFVEVKARDSLVYGTPAEAVTLQKQQGYVLFAQQYMVSNRLVGKNIRFDVIEVLGDEINHIISAFDGDCMKRYVRK